MCSRRLYVISLLGGEGRDHWFWDLLVAPGTLDVPFDIDEVVPSDEPAHLRVELEAWTQDILAPIDHLTRISFNGIVLTELSFNGAGPYAADLEIESNQLLDGTNTLTLEGIELDSPDVVFLDRITVTYRRAHRAAGDRLTFSCAGLDAQRLEGFVDEDIVLYQIDGPRAPLRIEGGTVEASPDGTWSLSFAPQQAGKSRYQAFTTAGARSPAAVVPATTAPPAALSAPQGADYIVICPRDWQDDLAPLAQLRRSQGLEVVLAPLEDIYDRFDGGRVTTGAIRAFLEHAWHVWPDPGPRYVLLVGDATFDPRGNLGASPRQVLPTRLIETDALETASDSWFADVEGDDGVPDLAIGRLPVGTPGECQALVAKLVEFESYGAVMLSSTAVAVLRPSTAVAVLVADQDDDLDFQAMNSDLEVLLPGFLERVLLDLAGSDVDDLRAELFAAWTAGPRIVHYAGHGSRLMWSNDEILSVDDVPGLGNGARLPLVTAMNCFNGFFHHPGSPSLGESLVLEPTGGAIAFWGPTAVTSNLRQKVLEETFYLHLFDPGNGTVGDAIRAAKADVARIPGYQDMVRTWVLLGDPALRLR